MRTVQKTVYEFEELTPEAQDRAREDFRVELNHIDDYNEQSETLHAIAEFFGAKLDYSYGAFERGHISLDISDNEELECIQDLEAVTNYLEDLAIIPKYGEQKLTKFTDTDGCPFTGICWDYPVFDIVNAVISDYYEDTEDRQRDDDYTFQDFLNEVSEALLVDFKSSLEYKYENEYAERYFSDYAIEFNEDGTIYED